VSTCSVCGEGKWHDQYAGQYVSHLACVENIYTANLSLRVHLHQAEAEAERLTLWGECNEALAVEEGVKRIAAEAELTALREKEAISVTFKVFDAMRGKWLHQKDRADEYEQELAELKGRRCETCLYNPGCSVWTVIADVPDFGCTLWQARQDGES
jgi:hypothetical protein